MTMLRSLVAAIALVPALAGATTYLKANVNGDDAFKMHISASPADAGFQFVNGFGWGNTYTGRMPLMTDAAGKRFRDYWINIYVQDVGGGGPTLLGDFKLTGQTGCRFDDGSTSIVSNTKLWTTTPGLTPTFGVTHINYPTWITTFMPPWLQPSQLPQSQGLNGVSPWGPMPLISSSAEWITVQGTPSLVDAWFQAHISCKP